MYVHLGVRLTVDGPNEGVHPRPSKLHYWKFAQQN